MSQYQGKGGSIVWNSLTAAEVQDWSLDVDEDQLDTSAMGDDTKKFVGGQTGWRATASFNLDNVGSSAQADFIARLMAATPTVVSAVLQLRLSATKYFTGSAIAQSLSIKGDRQSLFTMNVTWQGTGAITVGAWS